MSWIKNAGSPSKPNAAAAKPPASLELPTQVSARGIAPANAVIEHLTASECRFRTVVFFDHGDAVEFELASADGAVVRVRGSVVSRVAKSARFAYRMALDRMSMKEIDDLARAVSESYRKQAMKRAHERSIAALPTTERLTRMSVRVLAQFPVVYRTPKHDYRPAKAGNVSSGGLLMACDEALVEGLPCELRFTLPSDVLKVFPEETAIIDVRNATVRSRSSDSRRPFEEMMVGARVVTCQEGPNGGYRYGMAFTNIDGFQQEEIARYTNAVQRAKHRHQ